MAYDTIVVDIDGVLATGTTEDVYSHDAGWAYENCEPIAAGIGLVRRLKRLGYRIVLHTARWEADKEKTVEWMLVHGVPYDTLVMGKPSGKVYIDDRALRFDGKYPLVERDVEDAIKAVQDGTQSIGATG